MASSARLAVYTFGTFVLDCENETLQTSDGAEIYLRAKSFALLRLMVENARRLLTRETIMEALWPNIFVTDDNITQCVSDIRRAFGPEVGHLLRTVQRRGYIFDAAVVGKPCRSSTPLVEVTTFQGGAALTAATPWSQRLDRETRNRLSVLLLPL